MAKRGRLLPVGSQVSRVRAGTAALAVLALVAALLVGVGRSPSAAASPGEQFYAMQWNIAGATEHDGDPNEPNNWGSTVVTDRLADLAADWHPAVISVNEACDGQVDSLRASLEDRGMHVYAVAFSGTTGAEGPGPVPDEPNLACLQAGGYFAGVALLSLVPAGDPENLWFDDDTNEVVFHRTTRAGACLTLHLSRDVRACSLHLAQSTDDAISQALHFVATYRDDIAAYPYMLLGDFNATPDQLNLMYDASVPGGFGQFYEADMDSPNRGQPTEGSRKFDYAFASNNSFDRDQLALAALDPGICRVENVYQLPWFVLYPHPCSDHKPIVASLTLRDDAGEGYPPPPAPVDQPPTVNAGPDVTGFEGGAVQLHGSAADLQSTPDVRWTYRAVGHDVEPGVSCSFGDPTSSSTTFTCTDNGTFAVSLTADDGVNPPVSDTLKATLSNVAPTLHLTGPAPWQVYRADTAVELHATVTDPGTNDTHTCTVNWDDGTTESYPAVGGRCDRAHVYPDAGMYTISATVADDDGGTDDAGVLSVVYDPDGPSNNSDGSFVSAAGAYTGSPATAGELWFTLAAKYYHPTDTAPVAAARTWLPGTDLRFDAGDRGVQWLVATPDGKIAARGTGHIMGRDGEYGFVFYGYDGCDNGATPGCQAGPDRFRVVLWPLSASANPDPHTVVYDNHADAGYDVDVAGPEPLKSGIVAVHRPA